MTQKKRYCGQIVIKNKPYCFSHDYLNPKNDNDIIIDCPLDPSHRVYRKRLKKHLKKCPYLKIMKIKKERFYVKEFNRISNGNGIKDLKIKDVEMKDIEKINELYEKVLDEKVIRIENQIIKNEEWIRDFNQIFIDDSKHSKSFKNTPFNRIKHIHQHYSILGNIDKANLLNNSKTDYFEFGAGKAELTYHICKYLNNKRLLDSQKFYLFERSTRLMRKFDNRIRKNLKEHSHATLQRFKMDITHLCLDKITEDDEDDNDICVVSKHFCGAATDICLQTLYNSKKYLKRIRGIFIALCCHHTCDYETYINPSFFDNTLKINFNLVKSLSSWGVGKVEKENNRFGSWINTNKKFGDLTKKQRIEIGIKCKRIIDYGRILFLKNHLGFTNIKLVQYCSLESSPENIMLIATK